MAGHSPTTHSYDRDVERYLSRITRTKTGRVAKKQIEVSKQGVTWWRAQCFFWGLDHNGTIEQLQQRLDSNPAAPMIKELAELEPKAKKENKVKKSAAIAALQAEAEANVRNAFQHHFPANHPAGVADQTLIDLAYDQNPKVMEAAASLGLKSSAYQKGGRTFVISLGGPQS
jgi:hypothetical protein